MKNLIIILVSILIISCDNREVLSSNCDTKDEWVGFDEECGCYGPDMGFSNVCLRRTGSEVNYFGFANFGFIRDSIALMLKPEIGDVSIINVLDFPAFNSVGLGTTLDNEIEKGNKMIYEWFKNDWKNPPNISGNLTAIHVDPKVLKESPDTMLLKAYQYEYATLASAKIDSTVIKVWKDLDRQ